MCVHVHAANMVLRLLCVLCCIVLLPREYHLHFYFSFLKHLDKSH